MWATLFHGLGPGLSEKERGRKLLWAYTHSLSVLDCDMTSCFQFLLPWHPATLDLWIVSEDKYCLHKLFSSRYFVIATGKESKTQFLGFRKEMKYFSKTTVVLRLETNGSVKKRTVVTHWARHDGKIFKHASLLLVCTFCPVKFIWTLQVNKK